MSLSLAATLSSPSARCDETCREVSVRLHTSPPQDSAGFGGSSGTIVGTRTKGNRQDCRVGARFEAVCVRQQLCGAVNCWNSESARKRDETRRVRRVPRGGVSQILEVSTGRNGIKCEAIKAYVGISTSCIEEHADVDKCGDVRYDSGSSKRCRHAMDVCKRNRFTERCGTTWDTRSG